MDNFYVLKISRKKGTMAGLAYGKAICENILEVEKIIRYIKIEMPKYDFKFEVEKCPFNTAEQLMEIVAKFKMLDDHLEKSFEEMLNKFAKEN